MSAFPVLEPGVPPPIEPASFGLPAQSAYLMLQHQMRNKVGIIIGSTDILDLLETGISAKGTGDLARISRAAAELVALINEMPAWHHRA